MDEVLAYIERIPERMCAPPQPRFLHDLSAGLQGRGAVVELGTHAGKSTIALAHAQRSRPDGRPVHTVDLVEHPRLAEHLAATGLTDWVVQTQARSSTVAHGWSGPIELLWIDADHSARGLLSDLRLWTPHVVGGGVVAVHDYPGFHGADQKARAVRRFLLARPDRWRVISDREAGSIFAVERLPPAAPPSLLRRSLGRARWAAHSARFVVSEALDLRRG
ncbi:class I SAM-dependent methyltransferase [Rubrivirga sp. S365]|uniref:class I SAM-dependent methyltransferase n=1 Tax=Rubrivirga sp. S365 TaxID=3076080 RepID=UPI0028C84C10|nr:class I SAM-dependent methyltransferase [Rubrivirga sp. S365]MDT7855996.1 class I SAM-dependent methyltransferase [Rubrivirga sp. S365]